MSTETPDISTEDTTEDTADDVQDAVSTDAPIIDNSNKKDISYKIVIPFDISTTAEQILTDTKLKTKTGGFTGRKLLFWLVAVWGEETSYLGNREWSPQIFASELTNIEYEDKPYHVSTSEIQPPIVAPQSLIKDNMAAVPLFVQLPHRPAVSAELTVWKDDYSTRITTTQIDISLPITYLTSFSIEQDTLQIALDFAGSSAEINSFDLHFIPSSHISLAQYEEAFALQRIGDSNIYVLSFASNSSIKLLRGMFLGLSVIWSQSRMMSNFQIEIPFPPSSLGLLWNVPKLTRLKQASLSCEVSNISEMTVNAELKLGNSPMIPLIKTVEIAKLQPNEKRVVFIPCVPTLDGNRELIYKVKIGSRWFKPLFKTIVHID